MKYLTTISQFAVLVPLVVGLVKKRSSAGIWLISLLVVWLLAETALYITRQQNIQNLWISYLLTPLQLLILTGFYRCIFKNKMFAALLLAGIAVNITEFYFRSSSNLNSVALLYQCAVIVWVGLYTFYLVATNRVSTLFVPANAGITLLFMGSAVYYGAFISGVNWDLLTILSYAHSVLLIISYGLLTVGIWKL